jgi:hypothetical protein
MKNIKEKFDDKEIFKLLNDININEKEYDNIDLEMNELQKKKLKGYLKKKTKTKKYKHGVSAAAVVLLCMLGGGFVNPAFAQNIPILGSILQSINDKVGFHGEYAKYSQEINKSVFDKEITVTITEVICDDNTLEIGYTIKGNEKIKDMLPDKNMSIPHLQMTSFKVNGTELDANNGGTGDYVDEYTYVGSEELDIADKHLPRNFNFDMSITDLGGIEGAWNFKFNISKDQITKYITNFDPNTKVDFPDCSINISKVSFSPINTSVIFDGSFKKDRTITKNREGVMDYDEWFVYDDKGIQLNEKCSSNHCESNNFQYHMQFAALNETPKYLTVIPYRLPEEIKEHHHFKTESKDLIGSTYPTELSQGKIGKIIIKEVKNIQNKTIINYTAEGIAPYFQASNLFLRDEEKNPIAHDIFYIEDDSNKPNEFTLTFYNLDTTKKYELAAINLDAYEIREDLKFKIPLEN